MQKVILHTYFEVWQVDPRASAERPNWILYSRDLEQSIVLTDKMFERYCKFIKGDTNDKSTENPTNKEVSRGETGGCFRGDK